MTDRPVIPADADAQMGELLAVLPEAWSKTPLGEETDTLAAFVRAAYGKGYCDALEQQAAS